MSVPALPAQAIRDRIAADDFEGASALLGAHEAALRDAFELEPDAAKSCRDAWLDLLAAQRALVEELRTARDEAGRALDRLGRERRGVAAYLQNG